MVIAYSTGCVIAGNNLTGNSEHGIAGRGVSDSSILDCNITQNKQSGVLVSARNCTFFRNRIAGNKDYGLYLGGSVGNDIVGNQIERNDLGVRLSRSNLTLITDNNLFDNSEGISLGECSNSTIYHNNFVGNAEQVSYIPWHTVVFTVWDNGSEGNYWSNYTGVDLNGDGMGDSPYVVYANETDNHPLMIPYGIGDLDFDGKVDMKDLGLAAASLGSVAEHFRWNPRADVTGNIRYAPDGAIDIRDLVAIVKNFGRHYSYWNVP